MDNFKQDNKILFIPGWLDSGRRLGYVNYLDIWRSGVNIKKDFQVETVIAHSLGTIIALYNWCLHRNFRIILINPVLSRRKLLRRWLKYYFHEGPSSSFKKTLSFFSVVSALFNLNKILKIPAAEILNELPSENLTVIYGAGDRYLYDKALGEDLRARGVKVIEVKEAGHNYTKEFDEIISLNI
ncbi:MAG: alpha/beta hydrolase [Candidatus Falkowbacteria bacterium]|nr:MAG: alpha/beta hydrolase [Candidatus Falkowbacteria bacterium]